MMDELERAVDRLGAEVADLLVMVRRLPTKTTWIIALLFCWVLPAFVIVVWFA